MSIRIQYQAEAAECGLACLAMLASAHGLRIDLLELRQRFSVSLKGANLAQLIRHAEALGLAARPLRLDLSELHQLQLPCILHWNLNHFVLLTKVTRGRVTIVDPSVGKRVIPMAVLSQHFTGIALEITPGAQFTHADLRRTVRLRGMVGRIVGLKRALANVFLVAVGLEAIALVSPLVTQWVVDGALVSGDRDLLLLTILGGGLLMFVQFVLSIARGWTSLRINQQMSIQFTANLFTHLLRLPLAFFEKRHIGDIASRFGSLDSIRSMLSQSTVAAAMDGAMALVTLAMMLLFSARLSLVAMFALGLYVAVRWISFTSFRAANEERIVLAAKERSHFLETIRGIQPLKLFNRTPERLARWQNLMVDVQNCDTSTQRMELWFNASNTFIFALEGMLILYWGGSAVLDRSMTLGMLLAFIAYKGQFSNRASSLVNLVVQIKMMGLHSERLADIALEPPEPDNARENDLRHLEPKVELRNVSFRYADGEPWVLRDCSLTIEPGEHVAISGPSGSGKSTLLKLILGLLQPDEGEIRIGGISLKQLGVSQYRALVGAVMQNDTLMAGSLSENIAFFDSTLDHDRVEAVSKLAQIHDEIIAMPMGYQTLVGDMGSTLSGGQKQRILLARALYKQPKILALDEATSSLDADNERQVNQAVKTLPLTRITIAHRQETINAAQRVIVLDEGRVQRDVKVA